MPVQALHALQNGFMGLPRLRALLRRLLRGEGPDSRSPATWCAPRTPRCSSTRACRPAPCPACSATTLWRASPTRISSCTGSTPSGFGPTRRGLSSSSRTCTTTTRAGRSSFPKSELIVQRDEYAAAHHPPPSSPRFYYRKNFDLPGYRWRLLDGDTALAPRPHRPALGRAHAGAPVTARRAAGDGPGDPVRRRLLLAGAHRGRARARGGLESHGGASTPSSG